MPLCYFSEKISDVGLFRLVPAEVANTVTQYHITSATGTVFILKVEDLFDHGVAAKVKGISSEYMSEESSSLAGASTEKQTSEIVAREEKLPWELIEEILSRASPESLVRFRVVCKRWKAILDDKTVVYNHKDTFQFILTTKSKIYSVRIDPKIVVRELSLDIPGLESQKPTKLISSNEFLICSTDIGAAVCNPWLKQITWISETRFKFYGIGHTDSNSKSEESAYKTIWCKHTKWKIHDIASGTWKIYVESKPGDCNKEENQLTLLHSPSGVLLNGNLFWISSSAETNPLYHLEALDFSREAGFYRFCHLPCGKRHPCDVLVLSVFKGDRFSVLKQSKVTKKIEIWVTKNKHSPRRLVVCCCDKTGKPWIYVMGDNKLISKVHLDSVPDPWPLHCTYFPSLVSVPRGQRHEADLQV
ncbi:hypothetical protein N665_0006s0185 [Sinapis alba]|nr:hypothetical protein N665_0006s0185 [Sinapis alba]